MLSQFFEALLPQQGNFFVWTKHNKKHSICDSHDELIECLEHFADTPDTYYATGAFGDEVSPTTGEIGRLQSNVIGRRCMHVDFDCGAAKHAKDPDGTYATQKDALADVVRFQKATGIKFSHILDSGTGIHTYIALDEDIDEPRWKALAKLLQALMKQHGLKADDACTADSARILRAPGSLHSCGKRVQLLLNSGNTTSPLELEQTIVRQLDNQSLTIAKKSAPRARNANADVLESVEGPPKSIRNIAVQCAAVRELITKQGNVVEPFWRAGLGIAKFTVEGFKAAQVMSMGHPQYDKDATREKFDRWVTGPTSCQEFAQYCRGCHSCQHFGNIKSPIVKGAMTVTQVETLPEEQQPAATKPPAPVGAPWDGRIPAGFKVKTVKDVSTLLWAMPVENENEDGDKVTAYVDVPFTNDVFWFSQWADAEHSDDGAQVIACKWSGDHSKQYTMSQSLIANQPKLLEALGGKSIFTTTHKHARRAMEEYTKAQIQRIRNIGQKPKINTRFGIRITPGGQLIAAQGDKVIYPNGEIREAILGESLKGMAPNFTLPLPVSPDGMWGPEVWDSHLIPAARKHAEFMKKHFSKPGLEKLQTAAMVAFASPLMPFVTGEYHQGIDLPPCGFAVSLYSRKGGRGKSTLMKAAMLAYGNPSKMTRDQNATASTEKARIARLTLLGSCPVGMDEMGQNTTHAVANLVSALANGCSREGATTDGGLRMGSTWALTGIIAANKSQREMIAAASSESSAIQYRMMELDVQNLPEFDIDERGVFEADWAEVSKSAGALGAVIHRRICERGVERTNDLIRKASAKAAALLHDDQTSRFQYRALGAVLAVHAMLAADGLDMFDIGAIVNVFKEAQDSTKDFVAENLLPDDELELLSMFLNDNMDNTLVTHNMTRRSGVVTSYDQPIGQDPHNVTIRHIISTRRSYVNAEVFRSWCAEKALPINSIIHACVKVGAIEKPKTGAARIKTYANLYGGTARSSEARVWCYVVNLGKLNAMLGKDDGSTSADVLEFKRPEGEPPAEPDQEQKAV